MIYKYNPPKQSHMASCAGKRMHKREGKDAARSGMWMRGKARGKVGYVCRVYV